MEPTETFAQRLTAITRKFEEVRKAEIDAELTQDADYFRASGDDGLSHVARRVQNLTVCQNAKVTEPLTDAAEITCTFCNHYLYGI